MYLTEWTGRKCVILQKVGGLICMRNERKHRQAAITVICMPCLYIRGTSRGMGRRWVFNVTQRVWLQVTIACRVSKLRQMKLMRCMDLPRKVTVGRRSAPRLGSKIVAGNGNVIRPAMTMVRGGERSARLVGKWSPKSVCMYVRCPKVSILRSVVSGHHTCTGRCLSMVFVQFRRRRGGREHFTIPVQHNVMVIDHRGYNVGALWR